MVVGDNRLGHALARLAGKRLVFSNAPRHYVQGVLRALGVARWFDAVYTIESTRYRPKPAFNGFRVLLRAHNLEAHRCALIDDMPENLRAARRLGMSTVWVSSEGEAPAFRRPACQFRHRPAEIGVPPLPLSRRISRCRA
jgi:putative hydrolase of the HAD superfamily